MTLRLIHFFMLIALYSGASGIYAAGDSNTGELESVSLQLKWLHSFQFAGYYAANSQGYYAEEGLDVTLLEPTLENSHAEQLVEAVVSGKVEYGVSSSELINQRLLGKPVVLLAAIFQYSPYTILSRKDAEIYTLADLIGRRIAVESNSPLFFAMLKNEGLAVSNFKYAPIVRTVDKIISGEIDAALAYSTDQPHRMHMLGVEYSTLRPRDYGVNFYGDSLFTSESELESHPTRVAAFRRASLKGWKYAMSHQDELVEFILSLPGTQQRGLTADHLQFEAQEMQKLILPDLVEIGHINQGRLAHIADSFVELGLLDPNYSLEGFTYSADSESHIPWLYEILLGLAAVLFTAFLGWALNKRLYSLVKRRTRALRRSKELFKRLFDRSEAAIFEEDLSDVYHALEELRQEGVSNLRQYLSEEHKAFQSLLTKIKVLRANRATLTLFGAESEEHFLNNIQQSFGPGGADLVINQFCAIWEKRETFRSEAVFKTFDGQYFNAITSFFIPKNEADFHSIPIVISDISEQKHTEKKLSISNRLYATLSQVSQAIVREHDRQSLFDAICTIATEQGRFRMAWIGIIDEEKQSIESVAYAGEDADYLGDIAISLNNHSTNKGPTARAILEDKNVVFNDLQHHPDYAPWREQAMERGFQSSAAFPLRVNDHIIGTLNVYSSEPFFFNTSEIALVDETVADISFALDMIEREEKRQIALSQLRESEANLSQAQQIAAMGSWSRDHVSDTESWSSEVYRILEIGSGSSEAVHELFLARIHPDDRDWVDKAFMPSLREKTDYNFTHRLLMPDGRVKHVSQRCKYEFDTEGKVLHSRGTIQDISGHKETQKVIARFNQVIESSLNEIYIFDAETFLFIDANNSATKNVGYSVEELKTMSPMEITPKLRESFVNDRLNSLQLKETKQEIFTALFLRKNGTEYPVELHVELVDEDPPIFVAIVLDITEREHAEEEVLKLSQAVEQSPDSIIITNLDAKIEYVNAAALTATGYTREEIIDQNPRILQSGNTPIETHESMWAALSQGLSWKGEFHNLRKDGSEYIEFAHIAPIRQADGSITHYLAVKSDITEKTQLASELDDHRHHLEDLVIERTIQLEESKELAEIANQAKSSFLANMSHEIRTPMNAIIGLTNLLQRDKLTAIQSERLEKIDTAAGHLLSLINNILDISKIEASKLTLENSDFHLDALFDQLKSLLSVESHAKGLTIEIQTDSVPLWLRGDATRLRQALLNYLSNAIKFSEQGKIFVRVFALEELAGDILLRFEVTDSGIGIAPEKLGTLFDAFEQADISTTRKYGGSGLGLSITRHIAQLMDGEVGVSSESGVGSTFWFTAKLARGQGESPIASLDTDLHAEKQLRTSHSGSQLLLVEDNIINREVAVALLEGVGLVVDTAENGRIAVDKIQSDNFYNLVLMDIRMPEMDGLEATRLIRAEDSSAHLPILAITANIFEEDRQACLDVGMDGFIAKPFNPDLLYHEILNVLDKQAAS